MSFKSGFLFICSVFVFCESSIADSLKKCSIVDAVCQRDLYQTVLRSIGKTGDKKLGIPPIDPIHLVNVSVSLQNLLNITLVEGTATGMSKCAIESFITDIMSKRTNMEIFCNEVAAKGHYKASSESPLVESFLGQGHIHGDGSAKITLKKLHIKLEYDCKVIRGPDGEIYFKPLYNSTEYMFEILGEALFYVDNFFVGGEDMSSTVTQFLNLNAPYVIQAFGGTFFDKGLEYFYDFTLKFFDVTPTKEFIIEDLTPYLS